MLKILFHKSYLIITRSVTAHVMEGHLLQLLVAPLHIPTFGVIVLQPLSYLSFVQAPIVLRLQILPGLALQLVL